MTPAHTRHRESGFTMIEAAIVATLLSVAMGIVAMCFDTTTRSIAADDVVARTMENLQRSAVRISQILRPCAITTYRVRSVAADVPLLAAAAGEWIEPNDGEARAAIQFQSAAGEITMNAARLTPVRAFRFELDATEIDNDAEDDGDGMVDEGDLLMDYDGVTMTMVGDVEVCSFTLTGRLVDIALGSAARRRDGGLQRFAIKETLYLRNN
jgi:hypothetical protein